MNIFPKTEFLKIPMICSASVGIFPREFLFDKNPFFQRCYTVYSKAMFGIYIFYLICSYIKLYEISTKPDPRLGEISALLCTTLIYNITVVRQLIIKFHPGLRNILKQIIDTEPVVYAQEDKEVINIYNDCVKDTSRNCILYPLSIFLVTIMYLFRPLVVVGYEKQVGNQTVFIKALPVSSWFPFDEQTYYMIAYLSQIIQCLIGAAFVSYTDILMFSLIVYPTGQLKIMQYVLKNFEKFKQKVKAQLQIEDNAASFVTFREYIQHHKKIIQYVNYLNDSMNILMIFDFLQSSLQIATVLAQVLGNDITPILIISVGSYFVGMVFRLTLYYHYANEVIILSRGLAGSVWDSHWYEQPPNVKFMMLIFMLRTQKPLHLQIGPFSVMSLDAMISILKATYSYITIMYQKGQS